MYAGIDFKTPFENTEQRKILHVEILTVTLSNFVRKYDFPAKSKIVVLMNINTARLTS